MAKKLDGLDLEILHELHLNGRTSITELAGKVKSSRPTVTNRLKHLLNNGQIIISGGLSLKAAEYKMACVGLEVKNEESRIRIEQYLSNCPRVIFMFKTPEKANVFIGIWGEEDHILNSTIESFRDHHDVDVIYSHYLGTPIYGDIPINIDLAKNEKTPCGIVCSECNRYENKRCLGCPVSVDYKNPLLK
jgi:DNA-binding Lrp family transcriptional regulator